MATKVDTVDASTYGPIFKITVTKANVVLKYMDNDGHKVTRVYGYNTTPDHNNRQCVDFMHYGDDKIRVPLTAFLIKNAQELGIEGIISQRQVMGFPSNGPMYRGPEGGWRPYSGPNPHTDHDHVQFNTAAIKGTVNVGGGSTKPAPKPKPKAAWTGTLWTVKKVAAYDGSGRRRPEHDVVAGKQIKGTVDTTKFDDGRYFRTGVIGHRFWYPLDNAGFSQTKGGPIINEGGKSVVSMASLAEIIKAAKNDPDRKQGGTTPGAVDDVKVVENALQRAGLLAKKYSVDGSFGSSSVAAYRKWQKKLGYKGKDADGIPGKDSLTKLGKKYGFQVSK